MNTGQRSGQKRGSILIGALLLLTMAMSALCLLVSAQNHQKVWRSRQSRISEARAQQNRLTRIGHRMMQTLMRQRLDGPGDIISPETWETRFASCCRNESGTNSIQAQCRSLQDDPFEPFRADLLISMTTRTRSPGMAHQASLQGTYCSGRFPLGTTPSLIAKETDSTPDYHALFSLATLTDNTFSRSENPNQEANWLETQSLLSAPLGLKDQIIDWPTIGHLIGQPLTAPPAKGIYPVQKDNNLQALFIYGDIDRLILSQSSDLQKVEFQADAFETTLTYDHPPTLCTLSGISLPRPCTFEQNIIVIGNIHSLEQEGEYGLAPFCSLYLYLTGTARITTSLRARPTASGIPAGTITLVTAQALDPAPSLPSEIFIDTIGRTEIDGHLISSGLIRNKSDGLVVRGSISALAIEGIAPQIDHTQPIRTLPLGPEIRFMQNLFFLGIEEIYHDPKN